ncbi:type II toxin-antitoxin system RelE/ParE family toxin [Lysobacter sp. GX 14042]|uniref:type II toxin-antitoxin system RelE/ParE family toxin n=1 Tax=Lysobacter sp. GX 14042 TaxID=2907155 RepID=UPI001F2E4A39|nr:type II toxin-antitoxin system RelE/ParE family toxin [Lysobacter sp. GX 14042]MCE7032760.1 type II toxin-antitoxin system RelE/ParE family toxin [Lysobacter sp. GX 14042]
MRLTYSKDAVADLTRLRRFIAVHDPTAAARVAGDLTARVERLSASPFMGRRVEGFPPPAEIRDFSFGDYVVRYLVRKDFVVILRVWHHHESRVGEAASPG